MRPHEKRVADFRGDTMTPSALLSDGWTPISFNVGLFPFKSLSCAYECAREIATEQRRPVVIEATFIKEGQLCRVMVDRVLPEIAVGYAPLNIALKELIHA